ncbi:MAG: LPS translocon maturation chaperone LptM [Alphaproteobacteria bacterium]
MKTLILALALSLGLAACGVRGDLERPQPSFHQAP